MKKLSLFLALVMLLSVFSGTSLAAAEEPLKIRWLPYGQNTGEIPTTDNKTIRYLEERFNIDIEIVEVSAFTETWNVFWASGETADYIQTNKGNTEIFKLADQGMARSIPAGWLHEYAPDLMAAVEELIPADTLQTQISYNGENYIIPYTYVDNLPYFMVTRSDYLERLGVTELPKTLEEFHEFCRKLTFNDPDGNGINDTYALTSNAMWHGFAYLSCVYGGYPWCFYLQDDNTVEYYNATEEWKKTLYILRDWYAEGLIDPEFVTDDRPGTYRKLAEGRLGFVVDGGSWMGIEAIVQELVPEAKLVYLPPFANEEGRHHSHIWMADGSADGAGFFGASASDEVVKKVLQIQNEIVTDPDLYRRLYYGEEGVDYTLLEDGSIYKTNEQSSASYLTKHGLGATFCVRTQFANDAMANWSTVYADIVRQHKEGAPAADYAWLSRDFVPPTTNQSYREYYSEVETIASEFYINAVTGKVDIDKEWDAYIAQLNQVGLKDIIDEYNAMMAK